MPSDKKYLYLTKEEWISAWVKGGEIPLSLASSYLASERAGTKTPDEVRHRSLRGISDRDFEQVAKIGPKSTVSIQARRVVIGGQEVGRNVQFSQRHLDHVVLCLSNSFSKAIMDRLGKRACVEIADWEQLVKAINQQIWVTGTGGRVDYTVSADRNPFLKSEEDQWQDEFRIVWPSQQAVVVTLPARIGKQVWPEVTDPADPADPGEP
jgi:hypothetical protein